MKVDRSEAWTTSAVFFLGAALSFAGMTLVRSQKMPDDTGLTALVGLGVGAFGALVLTWWGVSFCIAVLAALLLRRGRLRAAHCVSVFAPAFMRRTACLVLGANLVASPSAYAAAGFIPGSAADERILAAEEPASLSPQWIPAETAPVLEPSWQPTALPPGGSLLVKDIRDSRSGADSTPEVTVHPGDSLWTIAARHLGPNASDADVAKAWPHWYAANRALIGEFPDLLQPGQILHPPASSAGSK